MNNLQTVFKSGQFSVVTKIISNKKLKIAIRHLPKNGVSNYFLTSKTSAGSLSKTIDKYCEMASILDELVTGGYLHFGRFPMKFYGIPLGSMQTKANQPISGTAGSSAGRELVGPEDNDKRILFYGIRNHMVGVWHKRFKKMQKNYQHISSDSLKDVQSLTKIEASLQKKQQELLYKMVLDCPDLSSEQSGDVIFNISQRSPTINFVEEVETQIQKTLNKA